MQNMRLNKAMKRFGPIMPLVLGVFLLLFVIFLSCERKDHKHAVRNETDNALDN